MSSQIPLNAYSCHRWSLEQLCLQCLQLFFHKYFWWCPRSVWIVKITFFQHLELPERRHISHRWPTSKGTPPEQSQESLSSNIGFPPCRALCMPWRIALCNYGVHIWLWTPRRVFQFNLKTSCTLFSRLLSLDRTFHRLSASSDHSSSQYFLVEGNLRITWTLQFQ